MAMLIILASLISLVFGRGYRSPCDCFDVELMYGYPKVTGDEVCYRYKIRKTDYSCPANLDYYILSAYVYSIKFYIVPSTHQIIGIYNHMFTICTDFVYSMSSYYEMRFFT